MKGKSINNILEGQFKKHSRTNNASEQLLKLSKQSHVAGNSVIPAVAIEEYNKKSKKKIKSWDTKVSELDLGKIGNVDLLHVRDKYTYSVRQYLDFTASDEYVAGVKHVLNSSTVFQIGFRIVNGEDNWLRLGETNDFFSGWYIYKRNNNLIQIYSDGANNYTTTDNQYPSAERVLFSFNAGTVEIYVDGVLVDTTDTGTIPLDVSGVAGNFTVGRALSTSESTSSECGIDDLFISEDTNLTGGKINSFFNGENPLTTFDNVISFYDFNGDAVDYGSLGNNGLLINIDSTNFKEYT